MKPSNLMIVALAVLFINLSYTQDKINNNFLNGFSIKVGVEWSSFKNRSPYKYYDVFEDANWKTSLSYDISKKTSVELEYIYKPDYSFGHYAYFNIVSNDSGYVHQYDYYYSYENIYSNTFNARINYNVYNLNHELPIYLFGAVSTSFQSIKNYETWHYQKEIGQFMYVLNEGTNQLDSYIRFLIGPKAGIGASYMFGKFGFNLELSASAKFSPFIDKGYKEISYILSFAPVYKF